MFCICKENLQKPKKKKEEANGTTEAKLNGKEAKPKKTKPKKNEDVSEEDSPAIQSEELAKKPDDKYFACVYCDLITLDLTQLLYRWKEGEEKETRQG